MIYILGTKINDMSLAEALKTTQEFLKTRLNQGYITTPNPEICLLATKDEQYRQILNNSFLSLPDGFGLKIGAAILGQRLKNRVTGADFTLELMKLAAQEGWRVFLFGGSRGVAQECQRKLEDKYGNLKIVGTSPGIIQNSKLERKVYKLQLAIHKLINQSKPDILLVALGAPMQEKWIRENLANLSTVKLAMGVGGTFDFIAGRVKRAPLLIRQLGLEWLWRLILQPRRAKRIYNAVLKFMIVVLRWRIRMQFKYRQNVVGLILKFFHPKFCGSSSEVECLLPKQKTAGSIPVCRSNPVLNTGQVLLVERQDEHGHWQLPQGGVNVKETPEQAIKREMLEELGTDKFKIIQHISQFHKYKWHKLTQQEFRGQKQDLFILRFTGQDSDINLDKKELVNFKWVDAEQAAHMVHEVRRAQVEKAVKLAVQLAQA